MQNKLESLEDKLQKESTMTREMIRDVYIRYPHDDNEEYYPLFVYQVQTGSGKTYSAAQSMALSIKYGIGSFPRQFFIASKKNMLPPDHLIFNWNPDNPFATRNTSDFYKVFSEYGVDYERHVLRLSAQMDYFVYSCSEDEFKQLKEQKQEKIIDYIIIEKYGKYYNRFKHVINSEIADTPLAHQCKKKYGGLLEGRINDYIDSMRLGKKAQAYKEETRIKLNQQISFLKNYCLNELRDILEKKKIKDPKEIAEYIYRNEKWLFVLYPDVCKELFNVLFMTVKKFISSFNPRTNTGLSITTSISEYVKGSVVYVDEIDSVKNELQDFIIENAQGVNQNIANNYLTIFMNILQFHENKYDEDLTEAIHEVNTTKFNLEGLKKRRKSIEPFIKFEQRYKTDRTIEVERYSIFMFRDSFEHQTFVFSPNQNNKTDNKSKDPVVCIAIDEKAKHYAITIEPDMQTTEGEKYYRTLTENGENTNISKLVDAIQDYFYYFQYFTHLVAQKYRTISNKRRKAENPIRYQEITEDNAFSTVIKEFLGNQKMTSEEIKQYKTILSYRHTKLKIKGTNINTVDYYQNGFTALSLNDDDSHNTRTDMLYLSVLDTPEKIILDWLNSFTVVGLSATAEVNSVLCNFNWEYISDEIGQKNYHTASETMIQTFKETNDRMESYLQDENICVKIIDPILSKNNLPLEERVIQAFDAFYEQIKQFNPKVSKQLFDLAAQIINGLPHSKDTKNPYYCSRYIKTFMVMTYFWLNGHTAFLHYSMAYPKTVADRTNEKDMQSDWLTLQMLFKLAAGTTKDNEKEVEYITNQIKKELQPNNDKQRRDCADTSTGAVKNYEINPDCKNSEEYCLFRTRAENFEQTKRTIQSLWEHGHPAYLIVSQMTASAGQNFQYSIENLSDSEKAGLITINDENSKNKEKDARYNKLNIDGLYIEKETHILTQINSNDSHLTPKVAAKYMCQVNDLARHYEIDKSLKIQAIRETCYEIWRQDYNRKRERSDEAVDSSSNKRREIYNADSVALAQFTMLNQTVGRMSRTFIDRRSCGIYLDNKLVESINNNAEVRSTIDDQIERGMMTPKMKRVAEVIKQSGKGEKNHNDEKQKNRYDDYNDKSGFYIRRMVSRGFDEGWPKEMQQQWEAIRDVALKLGIRTSTEEINRVLTDEQKNLLEQNCLYADLSELPEDQINETITKKLNRDPWHNSKMDAFMANEDICTLFKEKGYKTGIGEGKILMTRHMFNDIYKGALGEVVSTFILRKEGIVLEEIKDGALYEKGDRILSGHPDTLVDLKLVSLQFAKKKMKRSQMIEKIWEKVSKTSIKNYIVIETVLPEGARIEHWGVEDIAEDRPDIDVSIYSVPGLLDQNGRVLREGIDCMNNIIKVIEEKEK